MKDRNTPAPSQPAAAELEQRKAVRRVIELILESKAPAAWYLRRLLFAQRSQADE